VFDPLYSLSGFVVGAIVGITGVGGGSLMTPLLILLFGIHPTTAVGTDLLFAAATKTAGSAVHSFNKAIAWDVVGLLAAGSVPGAAITLWILSRGDPMSDDTARWISVVLGGMLVVTALTILFRDRLLGMARAAPEKSPLQSAIITVTFGATIGVLVSISSIGAGAVGVTVLMMSYPRMPLLRVVATDVAHAVPLTLMAGMGHWAIGNVDWVMLVSLLVGSVPGIVIASLFAPKLPEKAVRWALSTILIIVGVKLVVN
jgi:uncharacterized membrane protein YfcA